MRLSSTKVTFAAIPCIPEHQVIGIRFGSRPTALSLYATLGRCKPFNLARLLLYFAWYWFRQSSQEKDTARVASAVTVPPPPPDLCQCCKSPTLQCQYTGVVANSAGRLNACAGHGRASAGPEASRTRREPADHVASRSWLAGWPRWSQAAVSWAGCESHGRDPARERAARRQIIGAVVTSVHRAHHGAGGAAPG